MKNSVLQDECPWERRGAFELKRVRSTISARLPFFSEEFRDLARRRSARWNPVHKAWVFSVEESEDSLLVLLDGISLREEQKAAATEKQKKDALEKLSATGATLLALDRLTVAYDESRESFKLTFPFDETLLKEVRSITGSRWDGSEKCWVAPLASCQEVLSFVEPLKRRSQDFMDRNSKWIDLERKAPLSAELGAGRFALAVKSAASGPPKAAYQVRLPFPTEDPLHSELVVPVLDSLGLLDESMKGSDNPLPKLGGRFLSVEVRFRDFLKEASQSIEEACSKLGEIRQTRLHPQGYCHSRVPHPMCGDVFFKDSKGWMVVGSKKAPTSRTATSHEEFIVDAVEQPISACVEKMEFLSHGKSRCAWLSGIDPTLLDAYICEAALFELSGKAPVAASRKKATL